MSGHAEERLQYDGAHVMGILILFKFSEFLSLPLWSLSVSIGVYMLAALL
ncbi:hypothetical protein [Thalassobacillus sp. CUG 92003]|nr:hypothetical protein [Thalassobacillus sp. CUG 92003]